MRVVVQRVKHANVAIGDLMKNQIGGGLLVLLGVTHEDTQEDVDYLVQKLINLRIFSDEEGKMNKNIQDIEGCVMVVSQFTLLASTKKGNRPSFAQAAKADHANTLYESFCNQMRAHLPEKVETGVFGADMQVSLCNDGPVTIQMDSKTNED
jgi:D-tyrosyl-tRNA(Tyr) deacylase